MVYLAYEILSRCKELTGGLPELGVLNDKISSAVADPGDDLPYALGLARLLGLPEEGLMKKIAETRDPSPHFLAILRKAGIALDALSLERERLDRAVDRLDTGKEFMCTYDASVEFQGEFKRVNDIAYRYSMFKELDADRLKKVREHSIRVIGEFIAPAVHHHLFYDGESSFMTHVLESLLDTGILAPSDVLAQINHAIELTIPKDDLIGVDAKTHAKLEVLADICKPLSSPAERSLPAESLETLAGFYSQNVAEFLVSRIRENARPMLYVYQAVQHMGDIASLLTRSGIMLDSAAIGIDDAFNRILFSEEEWFEGDFKYYDNDWPIPSKTDAHETIMAIAGYYKTIGRSPNLNHSMYLSS